MQDSGTYVLCDFGSATAKMYDPQKHKMAQVEDELKRWVLCYLKYHTFLLYIG